MLDLQSFHKLYQMFFSGLVVFATTVVTYLLLIGVTYACAVCLKNIGQGVYEF